MFEKRQENLLSRRKYALRLARSAAVAGGIVAVSLGLGILGYHYFEHLSWLDALLNASMILSSMGPVTVPQTDAGKWFASAYALFSGVAFITTIGVLFAPVVHRLLHSFHLVIDADREPRPGPAAKPAGRDPKRG